MIFDIEADGLSDATKIHVLSYREGGILKSTHNYGKMREVLLKAKILIGHNIILYDIPTIERILGIKIKAKLVDTLALSWYLYPKRNVHGLESWGEEFGVPKPKIDDWENLSPEEYRHRCEEDVKINTRLWKQMKTKLLKIYGTKESADRLIEYLSFKMDCALEQEVSKWKLDIQRVEKNLQILENMCEEKTIQLSECMPSVSKFVSKSKPAKPYKKDGTLSVTGAKWLKLLKDNGLPENYNGEVSVFSHEEPANPNSHQQVKDWLFSLGWKPTSFNFVREDKVLRKIPQVRIEGEDGKELCPSVKKLIEKHPDVDVLEGLTVLQHRLSILKGFLRDQKDGWIIAGIGGLTNTLRFKHKILVNLPGVHKPWGEEIRGSLIAPDGYILCGSDMVSLEDTTKRHYMHYYDPEYVKEMSKEGFDPHLDLAKFAGAVTNDQIIQYNKGNPDFKFVKDLRKGYKAANYACVYGVQSETLSRDLGTSKKEAQVLIDQYWERNWSVLKVVDSITTKTVDGEMWLFNPVSELWYSLRHKKDIFSTLNQGTGVWCFDSWIAEVRSRRKQMTGQFHDEGIWCLKEGYEDRMSKVLLYSIQAVNDKLKLNVELKVDIQFGKTYAEIH